MVRSGNGKSEDPEIAKTFEHLDDETQHQDRWVQKDEATGEREISFGDALREQLGIEGEDEESESD